MVFSHQSKTTTRQRQDKCWTCHFLSPQVRQTWCERHHRNVQVQHLSCRCLVVVLLWCENTITVILWCALSPVSDANKASFSRPFWFLPILTVCPPCREYCLHLPLFGCPGVYLWHEYQYPRVWRHQYLKGLQSFRLQYESVTIQYESVKSICGRPYQRGHS